MSLEYRGPNLGSIYLLGFYCCFIYIAFLIISESFLVCVLNFFTLIIWSLFKIFCISCVFKQNNTMLGEVFDIFHVSDLLN